MNKFKIMQEHYEDLHNLWLDYWTQEVVFTYQWWLMIFLLITPFFVWWRLVDKTRLIEISMVGLVASGSALILDQVGTSLGYWTYPYTITPLERDLWAVADFSIVPFFYMMIYQRFPKWKTYLFAALIYAVFSAYIAEPIFQWLGIYVMIKWEHSYSVPAYVLLGIFIKILLQKFKTIEYISKSKE
jgi:hypothetical protein